jgi:hypothetical protein
MFKLESFIDTGGSFSFNSTIACFRDLPGENLHGNPLSRGILSINYGPSIELTNWLSTTGLCELGFAIKRGLVVASSCVNPFLIAERSPNKTNIQAWISEKINKNKNAYLSCKRNSENFPSKE